MKPAVKVARAGAAEALEPAAAGAAGVSVFEQATARAATKEKASRVVRSMGEDGTSEPVSGALPSHDDAGRSAVDSRSHERRRAEDRASQPREASNARSQDQAAARRR